MSQQSTSNATIITTTNTAPTSDKTLQLIYPQWQGGANPDYQIGARVLDALLPTSPSMEKVHVPIADELTTAKAYEAQANKAIFAEDILLTQQAAARGSFYCRILAVGYY